MKKTFLLFFLLWTTGSVSAQTQVSLPCTENALINMGAICPTVVIPVYGCDCNTYDNFCKAMNYSGITHASDAPSTNCGGIPTCHADFYVSEFAGTYYFNDSSEGSPINTVDYLWDFGDGSTSTGVPPVSHNYSSSGYMVCSLTQTLDAGTANQCQSTTWRVILVGAAGGCVPMFSASTSCGTTTFNDLSTGTLTSIGYDFGDGNILPSSTPGQPVTHDYASNGNYGVTISITDGANCNSAYTDTISVTLPTVSAGFTYTKTGTGPYTVTFTNTSTGAVSYTWDFGDGTTDTVMTPVAHSFDTCYYTVSVTAMDANFCTSTYTEQIDACPSGISGAPSILNSISVYPNPAKDEVQILVNSSQMMNGILQLKDINGNNVIDQLPVKINRGKNSYRINLPSLSSGIYLVQLQSGVSIINSRILVK